jgi:acetone carboxylase gamma subunit
MNTNPSEDAAEPVATDILFECPQCGKSLEIDARGAGYIIVCPDCHNEIQVPAWNDGQDAEAAHEDERHRVEIEEMLGQLQAKIARLEQRQRLDDQCLQRIGDELVLIQAALDRITECVETRSPSN